MSIVPGIKISVWWLILGILLAELHATLCHHDVVNLQGRGVEEDAILHLRHFQRDAFLEYQLALFL